MFPVSKAFFFVKKMGFRSTAAIQQQRRLTIMANPKMVCSCRSSCLDLLVVLVGCQMKGRESGLHHVYQEEYLDIHEIYLDGAYLKICCNCIDELWMGGKPDKLKKV